MTISLCVPHLEITIVVEQWKWKYKHSLFVGSTYLSESPLSNQTSIQTDSDNTDHYDSVMQWLNQQACGGTVKRKRKINKQQVRSVLKLYEARSCSSKLNLQFWSPVADPGFPEVGAPTLQGRAPTYDFAKISQNLHEIERTWTPRGRASLAPP